MKGRCIIGNEGLVFTSVDWEENVELPSNNGYHIEAFASADALIDNSLLDILELIYDNPKSQLLISKIKTKIFGRGILEILNSIGIIDKKLTKNIRNFKDKRNKVAHSVFGEYALIENRFGSIKTQSKLDNSMETEVKVQLDLAKEIIKELHSNHVDLIDMFSKMTQDEFDTWLHKL